MASLQGGLNLDFSDVDDETDINVMAMSQIQGEAEANSQAMDQWMEENSESVDELRTNIEGNARIMAELEDSGFSSDDVVSADLQADGSLTLWVDDRA
jgi:post-segregation antitoxin (ccd killing protein)